MMAQLGQGYGLRDFTFITKF